VVYLYQYKGYSRCGRQKELLYPQSTLSHLHFPCNLHIFSCLIYRELYPNPSISFVLVQRYWQINVIITSLTCLSNTYSICTALPLLFPNQAFRFVILFAIILIMFSPFSPSHYIVSPSKLPLRSFLPPPSEHHFAEPYMTNPLLHLLPGLSQPFLH
jgi:hypothetical protein